MKYPFDSYLGHGNLGTDFSLVNKASSPFHPPASLWTCEWQATGLPSQVQDSDRHAATGEGAELRMQTSKLQLSKLSSYPLCWGELGPII